MHRTEHRGSSNYPRNASIITDEMRWTEHNAENKQWVRSLLELEGDRIPGTADLTFMFRHHVLQTRVILRTEHNETEHGEPLLSSDLIFSSRTKTEQSRRLSCNEMLHQLPCIRKKQSDRPCIPDPSKKPCIPAPMLWSLMQNNSSEQHQYCKKGFELLQVLTHRHRNSS